MVAEFPTHVGAGPTGDRTVEGVGRVRSIVAGLHPAEEYVNVADVLMGRDASVEEI